MLHAVLLIAALAGSGTAGAEPSAVQVAARVQREDLPALNARSQAARAKAKARRAFFAGAAPLDSAFYDLAGRDLDDPAVVAGLLQLLDREDRARTVARVAAPPTTRSARLDARLAAARAAALDAEDADAALKRRLLLGVQAHLAAHPALTRAALDLHAAPFHEVVRAARALPADASPEARAEAERAAALADTEIAQLNALAAELRRTALVPGVTPPSPEADLARLGQPDESRGAAIRLSLLRPFLAPEAAEVVAAALLAWTDSGLVTPAQAARDAAQAERDAAPEGPVPPLADAEAALAAAQQALADREAALAALPSGDAGDLLAARAREAATLLVEAATLRVATAVAHLDRARSAAVEAETEARRTQAAATAAKADAAEATRLARDASERRAAALLGDLAEAKERTAESWERTRQIESSLQDAEQDHTERLAELRARSSAARELGPFAADRPDPNAINRELRTLVGQLREAYPARQSEWEAARDALATGEDRAAAATARIRQERETLEAIQPPSLRDSVIETLSLWGQTIADEQEALRQREQLLRDESDGVLRRLQWTRELRQQNLALVSRAERQAERSHLTGDIAAEMRLMAPRLRVRVLDGWSWLTSLPERLLDLRTLGSVFVGSFWALLVGVGWWFARRRAAGSAKNTLASIAKRRSELQQSDLANSEAPLTRAFETLLDLGVGWLIAEPITGLSPVIGLVISVYLHIAAYRFALALYELAFARHPSVRPSVRTLQPAVHDRLRRSVRLVLVWSIARNLVMMLLPEVLGLYTLAGLVRIGFAIAGVGLALWLLDHWAPDLRAGLRRSQSKQPALARLGADPPLRIVSPLQSAGILVFAAVSWALSTLPRLFREGSGLGKLASQVGQLQLGRDGDARAPLTPLAPETTAALAELLRSPQHGLVSFDDQKAAVVEAMTRWERDPVRGLMVLSGDRGTGKSHLVHELAAPVAELGLPLQVIVVPGRLRTSAALLAWMGRELGLEENCGTEDELVEALCARPRGVIVVEDLHRTFLRTVDGFEALRSLLYVMNASGARLFWLATAHRPAWVYLSALTSLLDTGVVRQVVSLPPVPERALRAGLLATCEAAGLQPSFADLARPGVFSDDPEVERERAARLFFRVLRDASGGNPAVASSLWQACLRQAPAEEEMAGSIRVVLDPALDFDPVKALDLSASLILHAVLTHDSLAPDDVSAATNLPRAKARTAIKSLLSLEVLELDGEGALQVSLGAQVPTVRMLRRKNLLTWTV